MSDKSSGRLGQNFSTTLVGADRLRAISEGVKFVSEAVDDPARRDVRALVQKKSTDWALSLKKRTLSAAERMELASIVAKLTTETLGHVFQPAHVEALAASTALSTARDIYLAEKQFFDGVEPIRMDEPLAGLDGPQLDWAERSFAGLGGLAATLGAGRLHDGWFRMNATSATRGDDDPSSKTEFRVRSDFVPFEVAKDEMELGGAAELSRFTGILTKNATGVVSGTHALLDVAAKKQKPHDWPGYMDAGSRSLLMSDDLRQRLNALAYSLMPLWQRSGDVAPSDLPFDAPEHAAVKGCLSAIHKRFSLNSMSFVEFDNLTPTEKAGNIPALLASIDGLLGADRAVRRILDHGVINRHGVTEEAFLLQRHLFSSVKVAQSVAEAKGPHTFQDTNRILARAVADEASLLAAHAAGIRSDTSEDKLMGVYDVYYKAAFEAGDEFRPGGGGPGRAAQIALEHVPELLRIVDPSAKKVSTSALQNKVADILERATMGDMRLVLKEKFGREDATEISVAQVEQHAKADDYFLPKYEKEASLKKQEPALTDDEREVLAHALRLANATWKVGQGHRVITSGDDSRGSPTERGSVFNPYDLLLASFDDPAESLFVGPIKDWLILKGALAKKP